MELNLSNLRIRTSLNVSGPKIASEGVLEIYQSLLFRLTGISESIQGNPSLYAADFWTLTSDCQASTCILFIKGTSPPTKAAFPHWLAQTVGNHFLTLKFASL